jgi:hypothetical protein
MIQLKGSSSNDEMLKNALSKSSKAIRISDIDKWSEIVTTHETPEPETPYVPIFSKSMPSKPSDLFLIANLKS